VNQLDYLIKPSSLRKKCIFTRSTQVQSVWPSLFAVAKKIGYFCGLLNVKMWKELKRCRMETELTVVSWLNFMASKKQGNYVIPNNKGNAHYVYVLRYLGGYTKVVLLLNLSTNTGEWSSSLSGRVTPTPPKESQHPLNSKWGEIENGLEVWRREKSLDLPGIQTSGHPALSLVPYWLRYFVSFCYFIWLWNQLEK
jgi:hypothetical protein